MPASLFLVSNKFRIHQASTFAGSPREVTVLLGMHQQSSVKPSAPAVTRWPKLEDEEIEGHRCFPVNFPANELQTEIYTYLLLIIRITLFTIRSRGNFVTTRKGVGRKRRLSFLNHKTVCVCVCVCVYTQMYGTFYVQMQVITLSSSAKVMLF